MDNLFTVYLHSIVLFQLKLRIFLFSDYLCYMKFKSNQPKKPTYIEEFKFTKIFLIIFHTVAYFDFLFTSDILEVHLTPLGAEIASLHLNMGV